MCRAFLVFAATCILPAWTQDPAALAERESRLVARAVQGLHAAADALQAQKQHKRALQLRRELLQDYDENDEKARGKCGFAKVGNAWRRDESLLVLEKDLTAEPKALRKIDQDLDALSRGLVAEHRALAQAWAALGEPGRALLHWQRVLRWAPDDKAAVAALALSSFEGFRGDAGELGLLRRARTIRGAVDWLHRATFAAQVVKDGQHPLLAAAGIPHLGIRTEHFEVWGALPEPLLSKVAQYAERSLLLCHTLFGACNGEAFAPKRTRGLLFVNSPETYRAVLDAAAGQFDAARLKFLKEDVDQAFLESGGKAWRLYKADIGEEAALDQAVRGVVQDAVGVTTDGLWEGIGHAACGFLFGKTLTFLVEQQNQRTSASSVSKPLLPDLDVWRQIAEESAWSKSDTRTSELVLLSASRFTNEQRVKAWAICDYLMLWRPELLAELDQSQSPRIHTPPEVEAEFLRRTKVELPGVDHAWREYWARGASLRAAMAKDPLGGEKGPDRPARLRARSLVDALNEVRAPARRGPVGFFVSDAEAVQAAVHYTEQLAKAEAEQKKKPKVVVPVPPMPPVIGVAVFWSRRATAAEAVWDWMSRPAWRDVLLHPGRGLCGSPLAAGAWILDVALPAEPLRSGPPLAWPRDQQVGVPGAARLGDLGPRAAAALAAAGVPATTEVGMPFSLHFGRPLPPAALVAITCRAYVGNRKVAGTIVAYEGEPAIGDEAPGCVAFVPSAVLPSGSSVEVQWELPDGVLPKDQTLATIRFTVR